MKNPIAEARTLLVVAEREGHKSAFAFECLLKAIGILIAEIARLGATPKPRTTLRGAMRLAGVSHKTARAKIASGVWKSYNEGGRVYVVTSTILDDLERRTSE